MNFSFTFIDLEKAYDVAINTNQEFHINIEENVGIKQVQNCLRDIVEKSGVDSGDIVGKICEGRQMTGCLTSLWWDENISLDTKSG